MMRSKLHSKVITVRITKELDDLISEVCSEFGYYSRSEFVREAIDEYVNYLLSLMRSDDELVEVELDDLFETSKVIMI